MKKSIAVALLALTSAGAFAATVSGTSNGVWTSPGPAGGTYTGVGTSAFKWGVTALGSVDNELMFTPVASFASVTETPFKIGTVFYQNGTSNGGEATSVDLALTLTFSAPALAPVTGSYGFDIITTTNTSDPMASADIVSLPTGFSSTSFLIGMTTYTVKLVGFENVVGDGFLASSATEFHVEEQLHATADLYAEVTTQVAAVPEPETYEMMFAGLGVVGFLARRRRG